MKRHQLTPREIVDTWPCTSIEGVTGMWYPECKVKAMAVELERAQHDKDAYRGALGYLVPATHDGKLSNGETPQCGLCNSEYRKNIEAELERVKAESDYHNRCVVRLKNQRDELRRQLDQKDEALDEAIANYDAVRTANVEMRRQVEEMRLHRDINE